ncbi:MAG: C39 family peptidase [Rhodospirillales bacterium]
MLRSMKIARWLSLAAGVGLLSGCTGDLYPPGAGAMPPFRSWQDLHYAGIVRQQTDFTCGAASLSTLSEYYLGRSVAEAQFTKTMRQRYSKEAWREKEKDGLSLLDMKLAAEDLGFAAEGVKMTMDDLGDLQGPIILHLDKGYVQHFTVLRGIRGDRAYLSDPILGNVRMPLFRLADQWTGYALAVWIDGEALPVDHRLLINAADLTHENAAARRFLYTLQPPPIANRI